MENNEDSSNLEFMSDDKYERLKRIAKSYKQTEWVAKMTDLFEELFEELDRLDKIDEINKGYDGWLDEKDKYKP